MTRKLSFGGNSSEAVAHEIPPSGSNISAALIVFLFLLYGTFGSSIPNGFGIFEMVAGALLAAVAVQSLSIGPPPIYRYPYTFLVAPLILTVMPTVVGLLIKWNPVSDFLRDFIPLLFLFLPIVLFGEISRNPYGWRRLLEELFCFSGAMLAARHLLSSSGANFQDIAIGESVPLNQCPTVIFSAVFGLAEGLVGRLPIATRIYRIACGSVCLLSLMAAVFRAQIFIVILGVVVVVILAGSVKSYVRALTVGVSAVVLVSLAGVNLSDPIQWTWKMIVAKTEHTGGLVNSRDAEAQAILSAAVESTSTLFFGKGWGSSMYLQTANDYVRYAHNSIMYFIWKTGFVGLSILLMYYLSLLRLGEAADILRMLRIRPATSIAIASSLTIFGVVEMGYKMMSFGFLLCLVLALSFEIEALRTRVTSR